MGGGGSGGGAAASALAGGSMSLGPAQPIIPQRHRAHKIGAKASFECAGAASLLARRTGSCGWAMDYIENACPYLLPLARALKGTQGRAGCRANTVLAIAGERGSDLPKFDQTVRWGVAADEGLCKVGILAGMVWPLLLEKGPLRHLLAIIGDHILLFSLQKCIPTSSEHGKVAPFFPRPPPTHPITSIADQRPVDSAPEPDQPTAAAALHTTSVSPFS